MFGVVTLVLLLIATATAARAEDGMTGPARWLLDRDALSELDVLPTSPAAAGQGSATDPLSRFIEHCKRNPIGIRPIVTLLPPESADTRKAELPTIAIFARAKGRALISLTRVQARADDGQEVVMQRTLVSDLLAGQRFSFTVYEDHAISDAAVRLMGVGTRLTFRPPGWPVRLELIGSYDLDAGASGFLAITGVLGAPPLPVAVGR
jgi:hypothetical protein